MDGDTHRYSVASARSALLGLLSRPDFRPFAAALGTMSLADLGIWMRPTVTFGLENANGLSSSEAGSIITAEIVALSLTMLLGARFLRGISFRALALLGLCLAIAASLASIICEGMTAMLLVRCAAAIGFGILATVAFAAAARVLPSGQGFGLIFGLATAICFVALATLPLLEPVVGATFGYVGFIVYAFLALPLVAKLPGDAGFDRAETGQDNRAEPVATTSAGSWRLILVVSLAFALHGIPYQGVWSFFYPLAQGTGIDTPTIGLLMSAATGVSIAASLLSGTLVRLIGRNTFILGAIAVTGIALISILDAANALVFGISAAMLMFTLFALYPAVFAIAANIDPSGRGASFLQGTGMLIGATGPVIYGYLFEHGLQDVAKVSVIGIVVLALVLFALVLRMIGPVSTQIPSKPI